MFGKSKVSQSMIDAVNSVLEVKVEQKDTTQPSDSLRAPMAPAQTNQAVNLSEASEKVPTPTGTKVYGSSYGNSKKARQDQTKSSVDTLKGPKAKEMKEAAKPDFLDMDKDGNKKESMKKAVADKNKVSEELKGDQHKIDANNNNKIDAQDFEMLRVKKDIAASRIEQQAKKKVKEEMSFAAKLLETVRKSDVPAYLRKAKGDTPLTVADVKAPKKDTISDPKNLAKARNEEVEGYIESLDEEMDKSQNPKGTKSKSIADPKKLVKTMSKLLHKSFHEPMKKVRKSDIPAYLKARNEEVELDEKARFAQFTPGDQLAFRSLSAPGAPTKRGGTGAYEYGTKPRATTIAKKTQSLKDKIVSSAGKHGPTGKLPEEVELNEDNLDSIAKKHGMEFKRTTYGAGMKHATHGEVSINRYGEWNHYPAGSKNSKAHGDSSFNFKDLDKHLSSLKEEVEDLNEDDFAHAKKQGWSVSQHYHHTKVTHPKHGIISIDRYGEWMHHPDQDWVGRPKGNLIAHGQDHDLNKHLSSLKEEEEVELTEEQLDEMINEVLGKDATAGDWISDFVHSDNPKFAGKSKAERKKMALGAYYGKQNETYQAADTAVTTDTLAGRMPGGKANTFKSYKLRVRPLDKEGTQMNKAPEVKQPVKTPAMKSHEVHEATIAGLSGWKKVEKNVKDKSGAVHTPMSRAKDLARAAFKDIQSKTKVK